MIGLYGELYERLVGKSDLFVNETINTITGEHAHTIAVLSSSVCSMKSAEMNFRKSLASTTCPVILFMDKPFKGKLPTSNTVRIIQTEENVTDEWFISQLLAESNNEGSDRQASLPESLSNEGISGVPLKDSQVNQLTEEAIVIITPEEREALGIDVLPIADDVIPSLSSAQLNEDKKSSYNSISDIKSGNEIHGNLEHSSKPVPSSTVSSTLDFKKLKNSGTVPETFSKPTSNSKSQTFPEPAIASKPELPVLPTSTILAIDLFPLLQSHIAKPHNAIIDCMKGTAWDTKLFDDAFVSAKYSFSAEGNA